MERRTDRLSRSKVHLARHQERQLYSVLLTLLKHMGIQTVYAGVTLPNEKSVGLHKSLGFRMTGIYYRTGYKCGKWHDVAWFEKALSVGYPTPQPILPLPKQILKS